VPYRVLLARPVPKQLDVIPRDDYARLHAEMKKLADEPRPRGCVKLEDDLYRIRVGAYRVIYSVLDDKGVVLVVKVSRRSEKTYRDLP
jgi:mRNA interferase RelE/StbE